MTYFNEALEQILGLIHDLHYGDDIKQETEKSSPLKEIISVITVKGLSELLHCSTDQDLINTYYNSQYTSILLGILIGREMGRMQTQTEKLEDMLGLKS